MAGETNTLSFCKLFLSVCHEHAIVANVKARISGTGCHNMQRKMFKENEDVCLKLLEITLFSPNRIL